MKIVFAASECAPFAKTGGLADVLDSLPPAILSLLKKTSRRSEVVRVLPKYSLIDRETFSLEPLAGIIRVPIGEKLQEGRIWKHQGKVVTYFIENGKYFDRPDLYGNSGQDFEDNDERFIFFSRAVLEFCKFIDFVPDVIHCHDWQTALIPAYLKTLYMTDAFFHDTATVFTIHNIAYQGIFHKQALFLAGFGWHDFTPDKLEYYDKFNFLKSGLVFTDKITTVSPTYSGEVRNSPEAGMGMDGVLKHRSQDFLGLLNGLDKTVWNPSRDPHILKRYSSKSRDVLECKKICKMELQKALGFEPDGGLPLIGMVTRLDRIKGIQKAVELISGLSESGPSFHWAILGTGEQAIQDHLTGLAGKFSTSFAFRPGFNDDLAHKIYAGSDLFFMPSEFEPCGLSQMIAMRYGSIPVATPVGGLADTIVPWNSLTRKGTGFLSRDLSVPSLKETLESALRTYSDKDQWEMLVRNSMVCDFSWEASAGGYIRLYESAQAARSRESSEAP